MANQPLFVGGELTGPQAGFPDLRGLLPTEERVDIGVSVVELLQPGLFPDDGGVAPAPVQAPGTPITHIGTPGGEQINGGDVLNGLQGDDVLVGDAGQNLFVFGDNSGVDVVVGFDPSDTGDTIAIRSDVNGTGLLAAEQLQVFDTEYGAAADLGGGNYVIIEGVSLAQLDLSDFTVFG